MPNSSETRERFKFTDTIGQRFSIILKTFLVVRTMQSMLPLHLLVIGKKEVRIDITI